MIVKILNRLSENIENIRYSRHVKKLDRLDFKEAFLRRPQKFGAIALKVLTLLSNVKTLRKIAPNFCGLLRKAELYRGINNHFIYLHTLGCKPFGLEV